MKKFLTALVLLALFLSGDLLPFQVFSQTDNSSNQQSQPSQNDLSQQLRGNQEKQADLQRKLAEVQRQKQTLSSQISYMDNQIALTSLKIEETQARIIQSGQEIATLSAKIGRLDESLTGLSAILLNRIEETYKRGGVESWQLILSSRGFADLLARTRYIRLVQAHDKRLVYQIEETKADYQDQKVLLEEKKREDEQLKKQLDGYKVTLARQKAEKVQFLEVTKNDEKRYQELLAKARAEFEAIQGIIAGRGQEVEAGEVKEGDKIASIIVGESTCSDGAHLHFEVYNNKVIQNPASLLSSKDVTWDLCGWFGCDDPFGFSGSWQWPINGKPRITQGYGMTAYARRTGAYGGGPHTGIDMVSENDWTVKAVKHGTLYRGAIACRGGTLRYTRVKHGDGYDTYYLHVNY